ncbi:MAG: phosphate signaling complex protein PhoU [Magnetococcales bacterium]|nr:phosphate signaling complex protein PhoU [Magnetococcales bacterium]
MAIYEQRLQADLKQIHNGLALIGDRVERALHNALTALFTNDEILANQTILGDLGINRLCLDLEHFCHLALIRHQPSAGHLRRIVATLNLVSELERVGDYATTICRIALLQAPFPSGSLHTQLQTMAKSASHMLQQALTAFASDQLTLARQTMKMADLVGQQLDVALAELELHAAHHPDSARLILNVSTLFTMLERVSDRAKNVCEATLFVVAGESKPPKQFTILFIDQDNALFAPLAQAIARQLYPSQALFRIASPQPTEAHPALLAFLRQHNYPIPEQNGRALADLSLTEENQIIISLQGPVRSYPLKLSFHTLFQDWQPEPATLPESPAQRQEALEQIHQQLFNQIRTLMETILGEEVA